MGKMMMMGKMKKKKMTELVTVLAASPGDMALIWRGPHRGR